MANKGQASQIFALVIDAAPPPPGELDLAASVVEYLFSAGTPTFQNAASVVEYIAERFPPSPVVAQVDAAASSWVAGPRAQLPGRAQGV